MNKTEAIARRILGWKLNSWDKWYDSEQKVFIQVSDFQPEKNVDHAMIIVSKLKQYGFSFSQEGKYQVCFNNVCESGDTLAEAITNAAYLIADSTSLADEWL